MSWGSNLFGNALASLMSIFGAGMAIPPMPKISIGEDFYPQVVATEKAIDNVERSFRDFREPLFRSLREVIIPSIQRNFDVEGRPSWQKLAQTTVASRKSSHPILNRTGDMRKAATNVSNWRVTDSDVSLSNMPSYGQYHQTGTSKMAKREFVKYQPEDIVAIEAIFSKWIDEQIRKGGFK